MQQEEYLEKAHEILLKLLLEFDRVCRKYDLKYYLICGSLLGAVRHQQFIPWDDDVDVAMFREDFEKLKEYAKQEWHNEKFLFLDYDELGKGTFLDFMTRLVYMEEEIPVNIFKKIRGKGRADIDNHLAMDIYVLDNASNDVKANKRNVLKLQCLYGLAMGHRAHIDYSEYKNQSRTRRMEIRILTLVGKFIPLKIIFALYEKYRKTFEREEGKYCYESNGWIYCIEMRLPKYWFAAGKEVQLYNHKLMAPKKYEEFLKRHYGDYMKLPPMEKRNPTHSADASGIYG